MAYKVVVTEHAEELLDRLVYHLLYGLKNEQAARHLLDGIEKVYERLEEVVYVVGVFHQLENYRRKV